MSSNAAVSMLFDTTLQNLLNFSDGFVSALFPHYAGPLTTTIILYVTCTVHSQREGGRDSRSEISPGGVLAPSLACGGYLSHTPH